LTFVSIYNEPDDRETAAPIESRLFQKIACSILILHKLILGGYREGQKRECRLRYAFKLTVSSRSRSIEIARASRTRLSLKGGSYD
jgi:hypothetical protein